MKEVDRSPITKNDVEKAYSYKEYRELIDSLMKENKTTGTNHSESMLHYTKMNIFRMKRLDKQVEINSNIKEIVEKINRPQIWLTITEAWCGDAAQIVPVIEKMADGNSVIQTKYILRDENLEIMDQFLTNGKSRSIPKLIILEAETLNVVGSWGPRPKEAQELYDKWRVDEKLPYSQISENLQKWYTKDKTVSTQEEIAKLLEQEVK